MTSKWDCRFLELAGHVATWSRDPSTKVGAVIVRPDKTIASVGFNGLPRHVEDLPERLKDRDTKYAMTVHAELNAILHAREPLHGFLIYVWPFRPCSQCSAAIIQAGLRRVVAPKLTNERWAVSFDIAAQMLAEAGVDLELT